MLVILNNYLLRLGTKPVPRIWDKLNLKALEPKDMRKDEQIKQDASKGDNMLALAKKSGKYLVRYWRCFPRSNVRTQ